MIDKDSLPLDKPRRTPDHPTKSHVVKTRVDGKEKIIRFGEQGAKTAGKPKEGESEAMKQKRASFKARHAKNIAKGKSSPAFWADKVKWATGGSVSLEDLDEQYAGIKKPDFKLLESFRQMISDLQARAEESGTQEFDPLRALGRSGAAESLEDLYASYADRPKESHARRAEAGAVDPDRASTARMVFDSFKNAGFSDAQAKALTAEINREGSFNPAYLFGSHTDAANKATNVGMLSWQGDRANRLMSFMADRGLIDPAGRIAPGQNALNAQAEYLRWEMENDPSYAKTRETFLANPDIDQEAAHDILGKNFIRWRIDDPKYRGSGFERISEGYDLLNMAQGYAEGGLAELDQKYKRGGKKKEAYDSARAAAKEDKGLPYSELLIDNLIGLDNKYLSAGERLGQAFNEDPLGFLKSAGSAAYEGAKSAVTSPIETIQGVGDSIYGSGESLMRGLDGKTQELFGVGYDEATPDQITLAREALAGDVLNVSQLIPGAAVARRGVGAVGDTMRAVGRDVVDRLNQPGPMPTTYANPIFRAPFDSGRGMGDNGGPAMGTNAISSVNLPPGSDPRYVGAAPDRSGGSFSRYTPKKVPERMRRLIAATDDPANPINAMFDNYIERGMRLKGSDWYNTEEMRDWFTGTLGENEGDKRWREFVDLIGATSTGSAVPDNLRNASFYNALSPADRLRVAEVVKGGGITPAAAARKLGIDVPNMPPEKGPGSYNYGHVMQGNHAANVLNQLEGQWVRITPEGLKGAELTKWLQANPKVKGFANSLLGDTKNIAADKHFMRMLAMADGSPDFLSEQAGGSVEMLDTLRKAYGEAIEPYILTRDVKGKPTVQVNLAKAAKDGVITDASPLQSMPTAWSDTPSATEYAALEEMAQRLATKYDMTPAQFQANLWMGAGDITGLADESQGTAMELFRRTLDKRAKERGLTREEMLREFIMNRAPLAVPIGIGAMSMQSAPAEAGSIEDLDQKYAGGGFIQEERIDLPRIYSREPTVAESVEDWWADKIHRVSGDTPFPLDERDSQRLAKRVANLLSYVPISAGMMSGAQAERDIEAGDYGSAALNAGTALLDVVPLAAATKGGASAIKAAADDVTELAAKYMSPDDIARFVADEAGSLPGMGIGLPEPRTEAEDIAREILQLRAEGRSDEVTDAMMNAADPQYMYYNTPLPMDAASREARMRASYRGDLYSGTGEDFPAFDNRAVYASTNPDLAYTYAPSDGGIIMPLAMRAKHGAPVVDAGGKNWNKLNPTMRVGGDNALPIPDGIVPRDIKSFNEFPMSTRDYEEAARRAGFSGVTFDDIVDVGGYFSKARPKIGTPEYEAHMNYLHSATKPTTVEARFYPNQVRSRFARFDPEFAHLRNLSAGVAAGAIGASQYDPDAIETTASRVRENKFAAGGAVKYDPAAVDGIINKLREVNRG